MMDLDIDELDFDNDRIKSFLKNKLEEIRADNERLGKKIVNRKNYLKQMIKSDEATMDVPSSKVTFMWKKICSNNYSLGYTFEYEGSSCLKDIKIFLKWTSSMPLYYKTDIYQMCQDKSTTEHSDQNDFICDELNCKNVTNTLKRSDEIKTTGFLVITVEVPRFTDTLQCDLSGNLICQENGKEVNLALATVVLASSDSVNGEMFDWSLANNTIPDLLTVICTSDKIELMLILPRDSTVNLESALALSCPLLTFVGCKSYFLIDRNYPTLNESLVEVHKALDGYPNMFCTTIYSSNQDKICRVLHLLHKIVPGVVLIPKLYYQNYLIKHPFPLKTENCIRRFKESVDEEIKAVERFLGSYVPSQSDDVLKFRSNLSYIEEKTDLLYLKLSQVNEEADISSVLG